MLTWNRSIESNYINKWQCLLSYSNSTFPVPFALLADTKSTSECDCEYGNLGGKKVKEVKQKQKSS